MKSAKMFGKCTRKTRSLHQTSSSQFFGSEGLNVCNEQQAKTTTSNKRNVGGTCLREPARTRTSRRPSRRNSVRMTEDFFTGAMQCPTAIKGSLLTSVWGSSSVLTVALIAMTDSTSSRLRVRCVVTLLFTWRLWSRSASGLLRKGKTTRPS